MSNRIYICHTFYHVYVACLKECNRKANEQGQADLMLSTMSNDFGDLKERAENSSFFRQVYLYQEKEDITFPELQKYHEDKGSIVLNMISRIKYTKMLGKLEEEYIPTDLKKYKDIYVFCDSDPIGYYLNYKKIYYHALEDGLDCIKYYDTARYDNRGFFGLKAFLSSINLIFIQNGYGKYCLDMEVNNIAACPYPCKKYVEQNREELAEKVTNEQKNEICRIFIKDIETLKQELNTGVGKERKVMILTEPLCTLDIREQIFKDIIEQYGEHSQIILKPHPRDLLNYKEKFPEAVVITGRFPMEVMNFIEGLVVDQVITIFTVPDSLHFAKEVIFLGEDFMDQYEDPKIHRQNEQI